MIYLDNPKDRILLKKLLPQRLTQTNGSVGYSVLSRDYPTLKTCLNNSVKQGITSEDEVNDVLKDLDNVFRFFRNLSLRERKVFTEGVREETDSSLKTELERSFESFCEYLDLMLETLKRLRNSGHLSDDQYQSLKRNFEQFRNLH